jgi:hypothetical protein
VPEAASAFANAPTGVAPHGGGGASPGSPFVNAATSPAHPPELARTQIAPLPAGLEAPTYEAPSGPQGYPVMNAQLSAQIATGATVFPSEPPGASAPLPGGHHPGPRGHDLTPPGYPQTAPRSRIPDSGSAPMREVGLSDPQRAANLLSPVGQQYPEQVDWAAAAASRARAVPPWLLAILFVGAIGIALALTVIVARLIR